MFRARGLQAHRIAGAGCARGLRQRTLEIDVARAIARRVCIGEVRCEQLGTLRAQVQRLRVHSEILV
jgi:hypothetical protein